jgi:hypothetical protein
MTENLATPDSQLVVMPTPQAPVASERSASSRSSRRTIFDLTPDEFNRLQFLSEMYAQSSFNNSKTPKKKGDYFLIMMKGIEVGLTPMAAVENIDIINGEPVIDGKGILGLIYASNVVEKFEIDATKERCIITAKRFGHAEQIISFTKEDAQNFKAFEWKDNKRVESSLWDKSTWKAQPEVMLMWRCVTKTGRRMFSDVISNLYTKDEMESSTIVHTDGSMEVPAIPTPALPETTTPQTSTTQGSASTKAWHEDVEALKKVLGECRAEGWIEGDTIGKLKTSFASLVGSEITIFETSEAASEAAESAATRANAQSGEAWDTFEGVQAIVTWAKGKGFGDSEPALIALLGKDWKAFSDGRAAKEAIEEAFKAKQAAAPTENVSKKTKLTDIDMLVISEWVKTHFDITVSVLVERVDLNKCSTIATAKTVIKGAAREQGWPVMTEQVTYTVKKDGNNGEKKSLRFETVLGEISYFKGRTEFSKVVGESYATGNGIPELPANEASDIEPLLLTWKARENYNEVIDALPVLEPELA